MLSRATEEAIHDAIAIEDIVGDFVSLKRKGQNLWACCPFHDEKTPSFSVSPSKGIFKCFGCGKAGDAITFIREIEGLSYAEALRYLAQKYGIAIEEEGNTEEQDQHFSEKESLYIVLSFAKNFYEELLWNHQEGQSVALPYLKERNIDSSIIKKFELGYSINEWDYFLKNALKKGYTKEKLEEAGLILNKQDKYYDRFRNRIIFPIHNISGKVIAFGARTLKKDKNLPKYINSPETEVYQKSKVLYGIHLAKQAIRQQENCYLVEGYTDVIALHQAGIENVVASSGTSLTEGQIKLISRYTKNITVLFDGDTAGIKASLRGIDMILTGGLNVKVVIFPDGQDPDSYAKEIGDTAFKDFLVQSAKDFIHFKTKMLIDEGVKDPIKKADAVHSIIQSISKVPEPITRTIYLKECSDILDIEETILIDELNKLILADNQNKSKRAQTQQADTITSVGHLEQKITEETTSSPEKIVSLQERESIRLLLNYGLKELEEDHKLYDYLLSELHDISFTNPTYKKILSIFKENLEKGKIIDASYFIKHSDEALKKEVIDLMATQYEISKNWEQKYSIYTPQEDEILDELVYTNILRLKFRVVQKLIQENLATLKTLNNTEEEDKHLKIHQQLKTSESALAELLGIIVS